MAKRKLRNWVKVTMFMAGVALTGGLLTQIGEEPHAQAEKTVVVEKELSYMEQLEINAEMAVDAEKENLYHYDAFYLYEDGNNLVFMEEVTMDKLYVKKSVLEKSMLEELSIGESVTLYGDSKKINFVELDGGYSVAMKPLEFMDEGIAGMKYVDEEKNSYSVDKDFASKFELEDSVFGSMATGYFYENKLIAIKKGW